MASQDGKIVFENTLDARLDLAFRQKLPEVCRVLVIFLTYQLFLSTSIFNNKTKLK